VPHVHPHDELAGDGVGVEHALALLDPGAGIGIVEPAADDVVEGGVGARGERQRRRGTRGEVGRRAGVIVEKADLGGAEALEEGVGARRLEGREITRERQQGLARPAPADKSGRAAISTRTFCTVRPLSSTTPPAGSVTPTTEAC